MTRWSRSRGTPVRLMQRTKIVLLAAESRINQDIAAELGIMPNAVGRWRARFGAGGSHAIKAVIGALGCPATSLEFRTFHEALATDC